MSRSLPRRPTRQLSIRGALVALSLLSLVATVLVPTPAAAGQMGSEASPTVDDARIHVDAVFELFLGRAAEADEVERWRPTVEWGDRSAFTGALAVSDEWAGTRVDDLYRDILGREPDDDGHDHWVERIASGSTLEEVAAFLYGSEEYFAGHGSTVEGFVDALYGDLLGRSADDRGRRFWVGEIEDGTGHDAVASGFYAAVESRDQRVTGLFAEILDRSPDHEGRAYWIERLLDAGDVSLAAFLAASDEFYVRVTGNSPPDTPRALETDFAPYGTIGDVVLVHPAAGVERVGFHESAHDGSQQAEPASGAVRWMTQETRSRGTGSRTAADIVVPPDEEIRAPVSGRVLRAGTYRLYCRYRDDYVVVEPDARPGWEVKLLHIDGVQVSAGDRVEAGVTRMAPRATVLPFASQIDRSTAEPSWPHVHVEVIDPSIPDRPSGGNSC